MYVNDWGNCTFTSALHSPVARMELKQAINSGRGVFRNYKNVLKSSVSSTLSPLLYAVVNSGGGKHAKVDGYDICGKTGVLNIYYDIKLLGEIKPQVFFIYWIR